jgi:hypothetical protein
MVTPESGFWRWPRLVLRAIAPRANFNAARLAEFRYNKIEGGPCKVRQDPVQQLIRDLQKRKSKPTPHTTRKNTKRSQIT